MSFRPGWRTLLLVLILLIVAVGWEKLYASPSPVEILEDTNCNGIQECYVLENKQLVVREGERELWRSPDSWDVKQIYLADADNEGQTELLMVLWKKGSFGQAKPMWDEGQDDAYSCHLFVYRLVAGRMKAVWCSSALDIPITKLEAIDIDGDGRIELQVHEGPAPGRFYRLRELFADTITTWRWEEWGFFRMTQSDVPLWEKAGRNNLPAFSKGPFLFIYSHSRYAVDL